MNEFFNGADKDSFKKNVYFPDTESAGGVV